MEDMVNLRAALAGDVLSVLIAAWQEVSADHRATGMYSREGTFERLVPFEGDPLAVAAANRAPHAWALEDGHAGFHMPSHVDWGGPKVKTSKRGVRYLIIPFRHYTPGEDSGGVGSARARSMMPDSVYRDALVALRGDRQRQEAREAAARIAAAGTWLTRSYALAQHAPGLTAKSQAELARLTAHAMRKEMQLGYTWRTRTYEGLRRSEQSNPETRKASGAYHTFRVMTQDSAGWWMPPMPGFHFAAQAVEKASPFIAEIIGEAVRADVELMVQAELAGGL